MTLWCCRSRSLNSGTLCRNRMVSAFALIAQLRPSPTPPPEDYEDREDREATTATDHRRQPHRRPTRDCSPDIVLRIMGADRTGVKHLARADAQNGGRPRDQNHRAAPSCPLSCPEM